MTDTAKIPISYWSTDLFEQYAIGIVQSQLEVTRFQYQCKRTSRFTLSHCLFLIKLAKFNDFSYQDFW